MSDHILFSDSDIQHLNKYQYDIIFQGGVDICKKCGAIGHEVDDLICKPRTVVVSWQLSNGANQTGRLVRENTHTAIVKPHLWIRSGEIKIHKIKSGMKFTGRWI